MSRSLFYVSVGWAAAVLAGGAGVSVQARSPQLALSLFVLAMLSGSLVAVLLVAANLKVRASNPRETVTAALPAAVLGRLERMSSVAEVGIGAESQPADGQPAAASNQAANEAPAASSPVLFEPPPAEDGARIADAVFVDDEPAAREALIDALLALRGEQLLDAVEVIASSTPLAQRPAEPEHALPVPPAPAASPAEAAPAGDEALAQGQFSAQSGR